MRAGLPFAVAAFLLGLSFGVVAENLGMPGWAAIVMSAVVYAGAAQFAALTIVAHGGGVGAAVVAAALVNSRFLPMGAALAPSLPGGRAARAAQGQAVVDASFVLASDGRGGFDRDVLLGSTAVQYVGWVGGTIAGVLGGGLLDDPDRFGLDAVYPAFFVALLIEELRAGRSPVVAALGGLIALALVPLTPVGVPVVVASLAALWGVEAVSDATVWQLIAGCAVVTLAIKAAGPLALGGRALPEWFSGVVALMAPALLSALVVSSALADGDRLALGADTAGVAAAGVIVWRGGSVILAVAAAAVVAGTLRAFF